MAETPFLFIFLLIGVLTFLIEMAQYISERLSIPQVLGEILLGIILGPTFLRILSFSDPSYSILSTIGLVSSKEIASATEIIAFISEMAGLLLLLQVGVEVDLKLLRKLGKDSTNVAIGGTILPLIAGITFGLIFSKTVAVEEFTTFDTALFLGVGLTATSIGISIRVLIELGRFGAKSTGILIGAAIIDDILALVLFSVALGFVEEEKAFGAGALVDMTIIFAKILSFALIALMIHFVLQKWIVNSLLKTKDTYKRLTFVMGLVFVFAWLAGTLELSPIIGAFVAGVLTTQNEELKELIEDLITPLSKWLIPFFFISVGFRVDLGVVSGMEVVALSLILALIAILSKLIGAGIGALANGNTKMEAIEIGLGMAPRGEVIIVIATTGLSIGVFSPAVFGMLVLTVAITAIFVPLSMKMVITRQKTEDEKPETLKL
ncbi:MAG: cation:proton antiporter [Methanobacteriota archaeon]|nr:MAG: cation:proton antiporter [Euryarchaeota archaeon]